MTWVAIDQLSYHYLMHSKTFRILFLSFLCLWFGIIVPGHQRGQIKLPGGTGKSVVNSCCAMRGGTLTQLDFTCPTNEKPKPSREDQKRCAMCQLIATLQVATPPLLTLAPMGLLAITPPQKAVDISSPGFAGPILGRAPPVA
ncbi:MAG TPA: hypothetical protein DCM28_13270 [Phycisphaerales bacterium]|nr:hypothetical protein [Phycisphaerales bacterium]HCD34966.1 hypothetical protein [Phycisphaerales bacterium]|tara:strand:+ start:2421 stop:2849 length:429 start_codon:yes stop_codon:yes gene_type:complete